MLLVGDPHMDKCFGWWCSYGSCSLPQIVTSKWVACHHQTRIRISVRRFTPANTGLDKPSTYPELGSSFKASFMKSALWFFAKIAMEIPEKHPDEILFHSESSYLMLVGYLNWLPKFELEYGGILDSTVCQITIRHFRIQCCVWLRFATTISMQLFFRWITLISCSQRLMVRTPGGTQRNFLTILI